MNNIIQNHKNFVANQINKGFDNDIEKAKRQVGEIHPNGKWVWKEYAPGKFDWRLIKKNSNSGNNDNGLYNKVAEIEKCKISSDVENYLKSKRIIHNYSDFFKY